MCPGFIWRLPSPPSYSVTCKTNLPIVDQGNNVDSGLSGIVLQWIAVLIHREGQNFRDRLNEITLALNFVTKPQAFRYDDLNQ
jgi:hypothetical protein